IAPFVLAPHRCGPVPRGLHLQSIGAPGALTRFALPIIQILLREQRAEGAARRPGVGRQRLDLDIAEAPFAAGRLESDESLARLVRRERRHVPAVADDLDLAADVVDFDLVPAVSLGVLVKERAERLQRSILVIARAVQAGAPLVELDARPFPILVVAFILRRPMKEQLERRLLVAPGLDPVLETQHVVLEGLVGAQVLWTIALEDQVLVLDMPVLVIADPPGEVFAVEKRLEARFG